MAEVRSWISVLAAMAEAYLTLTVMLVVGEDDRMKTTMVCFRLEISSKRDAYYFIS